MTAIYARGGYGASWTRVRQSSRPGELHPQPLTEPYVKVSPHTALIIQTTTLNSTQFANDKIRWGNSGAFPVNSEMHLAYFP